MGKSANTHKPNSEFKGKLLRVKYGQHGIELRLDLFCGVHYGTFVIQDFRFW